MANWSSYKQNLHERCTFGQYILLVATTEPQVPNSIHEPVQLQDSHMVIIVVSTCGFLLLLSIGVCLAVVWYQRKRAIELLPPPPIGWLTLARKARQLDEELEGEENHLFEAPSELPKGSVV